MSNQVFMFEDRIVAIDLKQSLATATDPKILYKKPGGTVGEWVGTISGTEIIYPAVNGEFDEPGLWQFEARVQLSGNRLSDISTQWVDKPLHA